MTSKRYPDLFPEEVELIKYILRCKNPSGIHLPNFYTLCRKFGLKPYSVRRQLKSLVRVGSVYVSVTDRKLAREAATPRRDSRS